MGAVDYFLEKHREANPEATVTVKDCLWMKDRFKYPLDGGYRDVILMVKIPNSATDDDGQDLWGEIQFHLSEAMEKKADLHTLYDVMRHFPKPQGVTKKVVCYHNTANNLKNEQAAKSATKLQEQTASQKGKDWEQAQENKLIQEKKDLEQKKMIQKEKDQVAQKQADCDARELLEKQKELLEKGMSQ